MDVKLFSSTVVPVMNGHPRDHAKVSVHCRWPLIRGNLTLKCVGGALITWPYKAGGRSRRGSPKAGTTVYYNFVGVHKLQVAILARSPREMSLTDRILPRYILS